MSTPHIELAEGGLRVSGDLTFATVTGLLRESRAMFGTGDEVLQVDLSGIGHADSAGLALLIEWLRLARSAGRELRFQALPAQMQAIARAGGLADVLPLALS